MDGVLVVDKPSGPTSHDVVAFVRRALREPRAGHTGTLDPAATGVLPIVLGRATRLARFLTAGVKQYEADVQLGVATETYDAQGAPTGVATPIDALPARDAIDRALDTFRGSFLQRPPAYSAKRIDGRRSYDVARARARRARPDEPPSRGSVLATAPEPALVTAHAIEILSCEGDRLRLRIDCSAGFYVRSLAHDLGERLGVGAHLTALRRTRVGEFDLSAAVPLDLVANDPERARAGVVPLERLLPGWPAAVLTERGVTYAAHGRDLGPGETTGGIPPPRPAAETGSEWVRLLDPAGRLVGLAEASPTTGLLHPSVILM